MTATTCTPAPWSATRSRCTRRSAATTRRSSSRTTGARPAPWGAAGKEPGRWRRCIILNIPPFAIFGENIVTYGQIKRSFYLWYFQMQWVCEDVIPAGYFAFIDRIWADWSPGYDASEDLPKVKECIREPAHFQAALATTGDSSTPAGSAPRNRWQNRLRPGARTSPSPRCTCTATQDGCHSMTQEQVNRVPQHCGPGSQSELIEGVAHFLMAQRPTAINKRILDFLGA